MTKRWLSLVLVLTLMSSLFTGVAMAAPVPKGTNYVITFVPTATEISATSEQSITNRLLGVFKIDGKTASSAAESALIKGAIGLTIGADDIANFNVVNGSLVASFTAPTAVEGQATSIIAFKKAALDAPTGYEFGDGIVDDDAARRSSRSRSTTPSPASSWSMFL